MRIIIKEERIAKIRCAKCIVQKCGYEFHIMNIYDLDSRSPLMETLYPVGLETFEQIIKMLKGIMK